MRSLLTVFLIPLLVLGVVANPSRAQTGLPEAADADWNGTWVAQGTLFAVAVTVQDGVIQLDEVQSLGFVWSSQPGSVNGTEATLEVRYAGVTAQLLARLTGPGTAVVQAASCLPEFMVVCALAKGQQAVFVREGAL